MSSWSRSNIRFPQKTKPLSTPSSTPTISTAMESIVVLPPKHDLIHIQYKKPVCTDTAVILVFFNPAKSFRILQNLLYVKQLLDSASIPYFIGELAYNDEPHVFNDISRECDNIFLFRSSSYMFSKENLIQCVLEKDALRRYSKYVIMDSDIVFDNPAWLDAISSALDTYDVIQPYQYANRLNLEYKSDSVITSILYDTTNGHPGYVWAFRRDWWLHIGGLYEYALIGGGDTIFAFSLGLYTRAINYVYSKELPPLMKSSGKYSYLPFTIWHLAHGSFAGRQYTNRSAKLQNAMNIVHASSILEMVVRNSDGIFEWKPEYKNTLNTILLDYFTTRKDDSV